MLGSFNKYSIILFTNKTTSGKDFDAVHTVVHDGNSEHVASLIQLGKYGDTNAADPTTTGYYVIKYLYETYTLQKDQTICGQVSKAGELVVNPE